MLINAYATDRDPPAIDFPHRLRARRDRSDPELARHLHGFMGFVTDGGNRPMTQMRYGVLRHLERVRHHISLEVEPAQMPAFEGWARRANAIVFLADSTVRAPDGRILVAPGTGEPDPEARLPYPEDAVARKAATDAALAERGIRVPGTLPPVVSEREVELRAASEVVPRMAALFACAACAEAAAAQRRVTRAELEQEMPLAFFSALTAREAAFLEAESPSQQDVIDFHWRYEAIAVLAWSLAIVELPFPAATCDVRALATSVFALDPQTFIPGAQLRTTGELLDALDLVFRLHWATTEARVNQGAPPPGVEPGVVSERHHALNWLTRFEDADWDDVTTPT